jgi:hypothetical protein
MSFFFSFISWIGFINDTFTSPAELTSSLIDYRVKPSINDMDNGIQMGEKWKKKRGYIRGLEHISCVM